MSMHHYYERWNILRIGAFPVYRIPSTVYFFLPHLPPTTCHLLYSRLQLFPLIEFAAHIARRHASDEEALISIQDTEF